MNKTTPDQPAYACEFDRLRAHVAATALSPDQREAAMAARALQDSLRRQQQLSTPSPSPG